MRWAGHEFAGRAEASWREYRCREGSVDGVAVAEALVSPVDTGLSMRTDAAGARGYYRERMAFSPMYTIGIRKTVRGTGELRTWLKVGKAS